MQVPFHDLPATPRMLILAPADDSISLSFSGGEGWGEEAVTPGSRSWPSLPLRLCPAPRAPVVAFCEVTSP
jgi:hypothetical protein